MLEITPNTLQMLCQGPTDPADLSETEIENWFLNIFGYITILCYISYIQDTEAQCQIYLDPVYKGPAKVRDRPSLSGSG